MHKKIQKYKWIIKRVNYYLAFGVITLSVPMMVEANDTNFSNVEELKVAKPKTAVENAPKEAAFDPAFLMGDAEKIDIDRFKYGNPVLPGDYNVDVYVNGNWFGKRRVVFKATEKDQNAFTCFNTDQLIEYGVKVNAINDYKENKVIGCRRLDEWVEDSFYEFDTSKLRLDISIPQLSMQKNAQGYVDPSVWNRGINAGFLSYNASAYKTFDRFNGNNEKTNAFMSLNTGLNLAGWQLRHNGQWQWRDKDAQNDSENSYESISTYVQRAFPKYRGVLTIGDSYTNGEVFDTFGYRGVDFSSDDRMLPNSMLGYAPRIRGNAKTNAKVEVRQQGQLIYQTTVSPGSFEINDLYPTGFGGELEVSVIEATGEVQRYAVPYSSVVQMLRPGISRYALTIGEFRERDIDLTPFIVQGKYQLGINNYLTGYGGVQAAEKYVGVTAGAAFATPIGAFALDVTHSNAEFDRRKTKSGQSYRISYSKLVSPTNTNLTLAAYRYSTENFLKLRDAILTRDLDNRGISSEYVGQQRSEFQVTLNQSLPQGWGNIYATGSWLDYWNRDESTRQYQVGYSNSYAGLTYGLSAIKRVVTDDRYNRRNDDTEYMLTLSLPLTFKKTSVNFNSITTQDNITMGVSGIVGDRFNYGASFSDEYGENPSMNLNAQYRSNYATVGGSYSLADKYQQAMVTARGNIVAHSKGLLFGPDQGQTMVLVHAPEAAGAKVNNTTGLTINKAGYAVIPYVTPYRLNDITLDPQGMSTDVELDGTSQRIAPYAGAITKVDFATKSGKAIYITSNGVDGKPLPFAAQVFDSKGEYVGMVAQGSLVYLRTDTLADTVVVKWGEAETEQCKIQYDVSGQVSDSKQNMITAEATCQ
ncbi:fimbria/pilus outer membrane usher protein [Acinetobacter shaoyimingii]|uniref:Fimbrial biogenesis outer membrane usher protein n=1 Tax=Acinetobacter shaoyimingii TaxID=2715164 RepID=A0A6G8RVE5_9GAMM|nr:fimbria/pilus outer membrane usher protein [Acinetobacter shaoyimingii]QIO05800.1 fimbrial biogenesis outer membrane usher protein [Acinetobacter shaoyimingii]